MNSFLVRRLIPFYVFAILCEFIYKIGLTIYHYNEFDFSFFAIIKTIGILSLTASVSFIFMVIPYVAYLLFLPANKVGSKTDRYITLLFFTSFVFITYFELISSAIFWNEFSSAFNFIAVDYLIYTNEVISNIIQSYPIGIIFIFLLLASSLTVWVLKKYIITNVPSPKFTLRLFHVFIYGFICLLAFRNVDITELEVNNNRYNNEIAKQGTYSLFSAYWKNEIEYSDFYLTQDKQKNISILQNKLQTQNITFTEPKKSIARQVSSFRPEKRANVIIILMESMGAKFLEQNEITGQSLTPNLDKLAKESLYFSNTYATGTRTVRGIEALNLSIPPLPGMSIVRRDDNEQLHSLGNIFKEKGYDNKWIYGGYGYFDNMNHFFKHNGFKVLDRTTWNKDELTFTNAWGACDEDLFNKILKEADKSYAEDKAFLTFALTISNHRPYTYPANKIELESGMHGRSGGVKYADYSIGKFLTEAKQKPWFDNTIFIFTTDHGAGAAGEEEITLNDHHVPLFIYGPKFVTSNKISTPISQIDILPTLLGLLDFNYESHFYGQNALNPQYESRFFISNYQKIGYIKNNEQIILKPIKQYNIKQENEVSSNQSLLEEAIAFYQTASDWRNNIKIKKEHK